jgi:CubicO group peptidase (beta-lactamase class C family)
MKTARAFVLLLVLAVWPAILPAQQPPDAAARLDRIFERWNSKDTPGCAVAIARDGKIILSRAYGMADLEHDVANSTATIFEAGSVSKQFTAGSIVMLAQQGKLSLDDNVRKYVPEVPDYGTPITIRHLLTHTSGLRDWGNVASIAGWPRTTRVHTHAHVLDIVSRQRALNFPPGNEYSYCNTGFNLLAIIVGRVSGISSPSSPKSISSIRWACPIPNGAMTSGASSGAGRSLMRRSARATASKWTCPSKTFMVTAAC